MTQLHIYSLAGPVILAREPLAEAAPEGPGVGGRRGRRGLGRSSCSVYTFVSTPMGRALASCVLRNIKAIKIVFILRWVCPSLWHPLPLARGVGLALSLTMTWGGRCRQDPEQRKAVRAGQQSEVHTRPPQHGPDPGAPRPVALPNTLSASYRN